MITQEELETAIEMHLTGTISVRSVLTRFLCGEPVEPGFFTIASLINFDRGTTIAMLDICIRATARAIYVRKEQQLYQGDWGDYWRIRVEYWRARWEVKKLRFAVFLLRLHIVDVIDTEKARARLSEYLRISVSAVPPVP